MSTIILSCPKAANTACYTLLVNAVSSLYISLAKSTPRKSERRRAILNCLPSIGNGDACLDIGTGHGGLAYYYSDRGDWTFIEPMLDRLAVARTILKGKFTNEDALKFLAKPHAFKFVTCIDAIQYIDVDVSKSVKAIFDGLAPGGHFLVSGESDHAEDVLMRMRRKMGLSEGTGRIVNPDERAMRAHLEKAGFRIEREELYCGPPTLLLQTIFDRLTMRSGDTGDRLTGEASEKTAGGKLALSRAARVVSLAAGALDRALPFLPRYGWVLVAERPA